VPLTLTATPECSKTRSSILLKWTKSSAAEWYVIIRNGIDGTFYWKILAGEPLEFRDDDVTQETEYAYYAKAKNSTGITDSNNVSVLSLPNCNDENTSGSFSLTGISQCDGSTPQIKLTWTDQGKAWLYSVYTVDVLSPYYLRTEYDRFFVNEAVIEGLEKGKNYTFLEQARRALGVKTKTQAIIISLKEVINKKKIEKLRALRGKIKLDIDLESLRHEKRGL